MPFSLDCLDGRLGYEGCECKGIDGLTEGLCDQFYQSWVRQSHQFPIGERGEAKV